MLLSLIYTIVLPHTVNISILGSLCYIAIEKTNKNMLPSYTDLIETVIIGCFIGITFPISWPVITLYFLYK